VEGGAATSGTIEPAAEIRCPRGGGGAGPVRALAGKIEAILHAKNAVHPERGGGGGGGGAVDASEIPALGGILSESAAEEGGDELLDERRKKDAYMRKSDSIKQAITDAYRTSKLLHNYSIMNYTGFVKMATKFDKTIPGHKGLLKGKISEDGRQAELLASKLEQI
jgi:hypothetical protein